MGVQLEDIKSLLEEKATETKGQFDKLTKAHEKLDGHIVKINDDIKQHGKELSETKDAFQQQVEKVADIEEKLDEAVQKMTKLPGQSQVAKTIGQMFTEDDGALKGIDSNTFAGHVSKTFEMSMSQKAITSGAASAGDGIEPTLRSDIVDEPDQGLFVRDLLMTLSTGSNAVEWVEINAFTNNAASQAGEGAAKAESALTLNKQNSPVQTIAHFMHASRQVLDDMPALRGIIDMKLRYGLRLEEEEQLLLGDGTGNNLSGLVPSATAYNVGLNVSGDTKIDMLRRAILQVAQNKFLTTGVVLNPADWCDIELYKTSDNAYLFSNPANSTETRIWGKRVVEGLSMTSGDFLLGAFGMAATLWDREQSTIRIAETDQDDFIKNMIKVLAEERLALTVEQPLGLVTGTLADTV